MIVVAQGEDRYDRTLGEVVIGGGRVTVALVAGGMAYQYRQYDKSPKLAAAEAESRAAQRGLRADPNPIQPWGMATAGKVRPIQAAGCPPGYPAQKHPLNLV